VEDEEREGLGGGSMRPLSLLEEDLATVGEEEVESVPPPLPPPPASKLNDATLPFPNILRSLGGVSSSSLILYRLGVLGRP